MMSKARCWRPRLAALAIATNLLSGCATGGSNIGELGACPPIVEYSREFQARACGRDEREAFDSLIVLDTRGRVGAQGNCRAAGGYVAAGPFSIRLEMSGTLRSICLPLITREDGLFLRKTICGECI